MLFLHRSSFCCQRLLLGQRFSSTQTANASAPLKASTFTGQPSFYETLYLLDDILIRTAPLRPPADTPSTPASAASRKSMATQLPSPAYVWKSRERMAGALHFSPTALQFRRIRERLNQLADLAPLIPELADFLRIFAASSPSDTGDREGDSMPVEERRLGRIDALGRAVAIGRRKSSSAKVVLRDGGSGAFTVNGRPLVVYFPRTRDRVQCGRPFEVTGTHGRFDAACATGGGGHTGQAGSICLAVAKAIATADPAHTLALRRAGLLRRDPRRVERKKYGREKARKKFAWYSPVLSVLFLCV